MNKYFPESGRVQRNAMCGAPMPLLCLCNGALPVYTGYSEYGGAIWFNGQ